MMTIGLMSMLRGEAAEVPVHEARFLDRAVRLATGEPRPERDMPPPAQAIEAALLAALAPI